MFSASLLLFVVNSARALVWYVGPEGNDGDARGMSATEPLRTLERAEILAEPGDDIVLLDGTYRVPKGQMDRAVLIGGSPRQSWGYIHEFSKSGREGAPIRYRAETPGAVVFDFTDVLPDTAEDTYRVVAFAVTGSHIHIEGITVTGVQAVTATGYCFLNHGSNNRYERLVMRDNKAIGFYLLRGADNLILNCDAFRNYDDVTKGGRGGDTDGFGSHGNRIAVGNVFRGCRAWFNSDDGYDCISSHAPVLFENCWAFWNGYDSKRVSRGDGNGFKMGGYGGADVSRLPKVPPRNTIIGCIAAENKAGGFYANHHLVGNVWHNNSAYRNGTNYHMLMRLGDNVTDVPGFGHELRNNVGFGARRNELDAIDVPACTLELNTFGGAPAATAADFESLEVEQLTRPRKPDGSLPDIEFMRPVAGGKLVDAGVDVGRPFAGAAPDLGALERSGPE